MPVMPVKAAGWRIEPPVSVPVAAGQRVGVDHVVAQAQRLGDHRGHRLDAARVDLAELLDRMVPEFNNILDWVEQLGEVDTSGVEPMTAVIPQALRLRDDVVDADPLTGGGVRDKVLANAPAAEHGFYAVPKVIE